MIHILQPVAKYRHHMNQDSLDQYKATPNAPPFRLITVTGCSEITRARCYAAKKGADSVRARFESISPDDAMAFAAVRKANDVVLWLDADIVFAPELLRLHYEVVRRLQIPIAGIYPQRIKPALAATPYGEKLTHEGQELRPIVSGMGALMLPAWLFMRQFLSSPLCADPQMERAICNTELRTFEGDDGVTMISEDYSYCLSFFERDLGAPLKGVFSTIPALNYGHVAEKVLVSDV